MHDDGEQLKLAIIIEKKKTLETEDRNVNKRMEIWVMLRERFGWKMEN